MKRHACHRDGIALFIFATSGQGDAQNIGSKLGIIEKQLIEIAHPVQHQSMGIIRFKREILLHHGGVMVKIVRHGLGHNS